ncbi:transposase, partial [Candidatus Margulisiibacteriota bacterium]
MQQISDKIKEIFSYRWEAFKTKYPHFPKIKTKKRMVPYELPIDDFIASTIQHIPEKNFRIVRFFGPYSNRKRKDFWAMVSHMFPEKTEPQEKLPSSWRERREKQTGVDPMKCPTCGK